MIKAILRPSADDIFRVCRKEYPEGIARVASEALYWSQFAQHHFRGKLGFYKTDADLAEAIGRHPKTAGSNLMRVSTATEKADATALFEVEYGPRPGQDSGRCRWLFITPRGEQIIQIAREARVAREDANKAKRFRRNDGIDPACVTSDAINTRRSAGGVLSSRTPQMTPTFNTEHSSTTLSANLSSRPQRDSSDEDRQGREKRGAVQRIFGLWAAACERCGRSDLVWRQSQGKQFASEFLEIASVAAIENMPDDELLDRLALLCGDLKSVEMEMSEGFSHYNKHGLTAQSFAKYGDRLLALAGDSLKRDKKSKELAAMNKLKFAKLLGS